MEQNNNPRAFRKGLNNVKVKDLPHVKERLMAILEVTTPQSLRNYADGRITTLDIEKAKQIEQLFASYGVADCWGI